MRKRKRYRLRFAGYICFLMAAVFAFLYFRTRMSLILLFILIILPFCGYMFALKQRDTLKISVRSAEEKIYVGDTACFIIKLDNPHFFPIMKACIDFDISNGFMENKGGQQVIMGAAGKESANISLPLVVEDIGIVRVTVTEMGIFDFFGIFYFPLHVTENADAGVVVLPKVNSENEEFLNSFNIGFLESEESTMKGSDFSDVSDLREYIPGDRLKDIHWKATAKRQEIMIKERVSLSQSQVLLVPDLACDRSARRMVVEKIFAVSMGLFAREISVMLLWGSRKHGYATESVGSISELEIGVEKIFMEEAYTSGVEAFKMYKGSHPMLESCLIATAGEDVADIRVLEI